MIGRASNMLVKAITRKVCMQLSDVDVWWVCVHNNVVWMREWFLHCVDGMVWNTSISGWRE